MNSERAIPYQSISLPRPLPVRRKVQEKDRDPYDGLRPWSAITHGAGALLAKCIKKCELIAYEDLGAEALRKLYVEEMPLVVIIDSQGNNLYEGGKAAYLASKKQK